MRGGGDEVLLKPFPLPLVGDVDRGAGDAGDIAARVAQWLDDHVEEVPPPVDGGRDFPPHPAPGLQYGALQLRHQRRLLRRQQIGVGPAEDLLDGQPVGRVVDPGVAKGQVLAEDDDRRAGQGEPEALGGQSQLLLRPLALGYVFDDLDGEHSVAGLVLDVGVGHLHPDDRAVAAQVAPFGGRGRRRGLGLGYEDGLGSCAIIGVRPFLNPAADQVGRRVAEQPAVGGVDRLDPPSAPIWTTPTGACSKVRRNRCSLARRAASARSRAAVRPLIKRATSRKETRRCRSPQVSSSGPLGSRKKTSRATSERRVVTRAGTNPPIPGGEGDGGVEKREPDPTQPRLQEPGQGHREGGDGHRRAVATRR